MVLRPGLESIGDEQQDDLKARAVTKKLSDFAVAQSLQDCKRMYIDDPRARGGRPNVPVVLG
jgi:hypothetical protein